MGVKRVIVHIDRLVLRGFRHEDRHAIATGLQQGLVEVLTGLQAGTQSAVWGNVPLSRAERVHVGPGASPQQVGVEVARGTRRRMKV